MSWELLHLTVHSAPFQFDGAAITYCELLDGPTRDFNLMTRDGNARLERVAGSRIFPCRTGALVAVYAPTVEATVVCDGERQDLSPNTFGWRILDSDVQVELVATEALWMEIVP